MSYSNWPDADSLPQEWFVADSGPNYAPVDNTVRTPMEHGPAKLRRRFTAVPEDVTLTGQLNEEELAALRYFVKTTLEDVLPFNFTDFRTGDPCVCRFKAGWSSVKHVWDGGWWSVTMELEVMP